MVDDVPREGLHRVAVALKARGELRADGEDRRGVAGLDQLAHLGPREALQGSARRSVGPQRRRVGLLGACGRGCRRLGRGLCRGLCCGDVGVLAPLALRPLLALRALRAGRARVALLALRPLLALGAGRARGPGVALLALQLARVQLRPHLVGHGLRGLRGPVGLGGACGRGGRGAGRGLRGTVRPLGGAGRRGCGPVGLARRRFRLLGGTRGLGGRGGDLGLGGARGVLRGLDGLGGGVHGLGERLKLALGGVRHVLAQLGGLLAQVVGGRVEDQGAGHAGRAHQLHAVGPHAREAHAQRPGAAHLGGHGHAVRPVLGDGLAALLPGHADLQAVPVGVEGRAGGVVPCRAAHQARAVGAGGHCLVADVEEELVRHATRRPSRPWRPRAGVPAGSRAGRGWPCRCSPRCSPAP